MRAETLRQHPELSGILNRLAGRITAEEMQEMNYLVKVKGKAAAEVARQYLQQHHLLK